MDPLIDVLAFAGRAGLRLRADGGRLAITGPPSAEPLAQSLFEHRDLLIDWITTGRVQLDWCEHRVRDPAPCRRCGQPARLRDNTDQPLHKTCAEQVIQRRLLALLAPGGTPPAAS